MSDDREPTHDLSALGVSAADAIAGMEAALPAIAAAGMSAADATAPIPSEWFTAHPEDGTTQ